MNTRPAGEIAGGRATLKKKEEGPHSIEMTDPF